MTGPEETEGTPRQRGHLHIKAIRCTVSNTSIAGDGVNVLIEAEEVLLTGDNIR